MPNDNTFLEKFDIDRLDEQTGTVNLIKEDQSGSDTFKKFVDVRNELIKHVDKTLNDIEKRVEIEEYTIGKSVAHEIGGGKPFDAKDCKTWDQDVIKGYQWDKGYKRKNYNGLMVVAAVTDKKVLTKIQKELHVNHQQYAFALKQSLIQEFMLVRGDGRIANLSFETGGKSRSSCLGIVLLAYKFKKNDIPRYEDAKLEPGYAYYDMATNNGNVLTEVWVEKQTEIIRTILKEAKSTDNDEYRQIVGLTIGYSYTCQIRSKDGTTIFKPCDPKTWREAGSIESIWNTEYENEGYHKLVALTVISKETVKNGDWSTYAEKAITKLNSKLVDEYGDLFTECQYIKGEKWETAAVLYVAYKVKEYKPIKIQNIDVEGQHTFTILSNINDEEASKRVKLIQQDIENTLETVVEVTGKQIDRFMIGKAEGTRKDLTYGDSFEPGRSTLERSRNLLRKLTNLKPDFEYCLVLAAITREIFKHNETKDKVQYANDLQGEVVEQLKQNVKWKKKYNVKRQQQVSNNAGVIIMFMAFKLQEEQKADTK